MIKHRDGRRFTSNQQTVSEYSVGRKWSTRFYVTQPNGRDRSDVELDFKVVGKERITVPAGTFDCFKVEGSGGAYGEPLRIRNAYWIAPGQAKRQIASESIRNRGPKIVASERVELVSFKEA